MLLKSTRRKVRPATADECRRIMGYIPTQIPPVSAPPPPPPPLYRLYPNRSSLRGFLPGARTGIHTQPDTHRDAETRRRLTLAVHMDACVCVRGWACCAMLQGAYATEGVCIVMDSALSAGGDETKPLRTPADPWHPPVHPFPTPGLCLCLCLCLCFGLCLRLCLCGGLSKP